MRKYYGEIMLSPDVEKQIKWFTFNWDKEIGAFGSGKVKDGILYVNKLHFPTQEVTGASVDFEAEDWGEMLKEMSLDEIGNINFYWHRHPNNSVGASHTDDEKTFDRIMDTDLKRDVFGFAQTCKKTDGSMEWEARIEVRKPIYGTVEAEVTTIEDKEIEEKCRKIIDERIRKPKPVFDRNKYTTIIKNEPKESIVNSQMFGSPSETNVEKNVGMGLTDLTIPIERCFMVKENGNKAVVFCGKHIEKALLKQMNDTNYIGSYIKSYKIKENHDNYKIYEVKPMKKYYSTMIGLLFYFDEKYSDKMKAELRETVESLEEDGSMDSDTLDNFLTGIDAFDLEDFFDGDAVAVMTSTMGII